MPLLDTSKVSTPARQAASVSPNGLKKISVIGNFSGRNAGDAAILGGLLKDISARYPNVRFLVPTLNPSFVRSHFRSPTVVPVSLRPPLNLKIFGLGVLQAAYDCDLFLITDAILFDRQLLNPLYNYLSTLALVAQLVKQRGVPLVLYNVSLGPVYTPLGQLFMKVLLRAADLVIARDEESIALMTQLGIDTNKARLAADSALSAPFSSPEKLGPVLAKERIRFPSGGTIGFNVSRYLFESYIPEAKGLMDAQRFADIVSKSIDRVIDELGVDVLMFSTQIMDLPIVRQVLSRLRRPERVRLISNKTYSHEDIKALLARVDIFVGMRTHSLILASSGRTPVLGIIAYPKSRAFLNSIQQLEWKLEYNDFRVDHVVDRIKDLWRERENVRRRLEEIMPVMEARARGSAELLAPYLLNGVHVN
ncbi:MAG: polysaccharide pyruvyl transferase family protein [Elusimicrobia bacterium]|nr:polysaccharide pyruvyl transferase family protein [Elusimicrobiota bacterium]